MQNVNAELYKQLTTATDAATDQTATDQEIESFFDFRMRTPKDVNHVLNIFAFRLIEGKIDTRSCVLDCNLDNAYVTRVQTIIH